MKIFEYNFTLLPSHCSSYTLQLSILTPSTAALVYNLNPIPCDARSHVHLTFIFVGDAIGSAHRRGRSIRWTLSGALADRAVIFIQCTDLTLTWTLDAVTKL
jgi:hypothetical protein